jgi:spermidine/putrescine-binding protein
MLMNFLLSPEIYAKRLEFYPFPPMIEEAKQYLSPALLDNPALNMPPSVTEGAWMIPVSDAQVDLMDKYLTKFMSENQ